jgi:hypothetical protein
MKVHSLHWQVMDPPLGLGKPAKAGERSIADRRYEICRDDEIFNRAPVPYRNILSDHLYRYPARVLSGSGDWCRKQPDRVRDHGVDGLLYHSQICTCVDQRAQQHVACDASGGIDPGMASAVHGAAIWAAK